MRLKKILLVEDDSSLRSAIESFLKKLEIYQVKSVGDAVSALAELDSDEYDLVLSDVKMPGGSGYDILKYMKSKNYQMPIIYMTAYGSIEDAVSVMKDGAYDFIVKPFQLTTLENVLNSALLDAEAQLNQDPQNANDENNSQDKFGRNEKVFITENKHVLELIDNLKRVANSKATVLIQGESGTGKEVLANMIHHFSPRQTKPFVAINCAALPDNLLESELFGHEKGSFTGAIQRQLGKFEYADGGTILLDEISEMSINMQTKLLRVLQECEIYRIGGNKPIPLNIRVIAATNRDLYKYMKEGNFREDLYYRINVIPLFVPPLRDRGNDVIVLANHFLQEFSKAHDRDQIEMDELARYKILNYEWQGNVRELRNAMERAILVGNFDQIGHDENFTNIQSAKMTPEKSTTQENQSSLQSYTGSITGNQDLSLEEVEKRVIFETLSRNDGNRTRTAEKLGISLRTLRNKLKSFKEEEEALLNKNS